MDIANYGFQQNSAELLYFYEITACYLNKEGLFMRMPPISLIECRNSLGQSQIA
jgi:hypothetical protein